MWRTYRQTDRQRERERERTLLGNHYIFNYM